jgi:hypothetical protein
MRHSRSLRRHRNPEEDEMASFLDEELEDAETDDVSFEEEEEEEEEGLEDDFTDSDDSEEFDEVKSSIRSLISRPPQRKAVSLQRREREKEVQKEFTKRQKEVTSSSSHSPNTIAFGDKLLRQIKSLNSSLVPILRADYAEASSKVASVVGKFTPNSTEAVAIAIDKTIEAAKLVRIFSKHFSTDYSDWLSSPAINSSVGFDRSPQSYDDSAVDYDDAVTDFIAKYENLLATICGGKNNVTLRFRKYPEPLSGILVQMLAPLSAAYEVKHILPV